MSDALQTWLGLPDARLADMAAARSGVWLWAHDVSRLIWANPAGSAVVAVGPVGRADPQRRQLTQLAPRLTDKVRLERLRGFGAAPGGLMTCACSRLTLAEGEAAILVVAMERTLPALPSRERLARLVAPLEAPLAAFTADGHFAGASQSGQGLLGRQPASLDDLAGSGAGDVRTAVLRDGAATIAGLAGQLALRRLGRGADAALVARLSADFIPMATATPHPAAVNALPAPAPPERAQPPGAAPPEPSLPPPAAPVPARPLRFMWQMDAAGRFSFGADAFTRLIGPATAAAFGRPWHEINAALNLDPDDRVLRAVATQRTFSGITVRWPVDGSDLRLPVELSALPLHDSARRFAGYRGFAVCRDLDALGRLAAHRRSETLQRRAPPPSDPPTDLAMPLDPPHNVLPFPSVNGDATASLTPVENNAFNELARQLSERLERPVTPPPPETAATKEAAPPAPGPSAVALRAMLDAVADAALTLAPDGRITSVNRAASELFGADVTALARRTVFDLLAPADHAPLRAALTDAATSASREVEGRSIDGRAVPLAMTLARAADDTAFVVFHNLTAERERERERHDLLRQVERARADKAGLADWASRELRTPTETIAALATIISDEHPAAAEQYGAHLRDIRSNAQRILKTLDEVRDLARIESGDFSLAPTALNLNDVVEAAIADQQPQAGRARVVIRSSLAPALPPVEADAAALRQIATNLIAVSIHLANAGGQAIVSTARTDEGGVMLRLRDTGPGLTEDELATANEPLSLKPPADHATLDNAGINIALTRALIEASGATFAIRSAAASGTLIEVAFKRADIAAA